MSTVFAATCAMNGSTPRVAVIGAGVVGSAVGLALARRGAAVTLLEAEREPGLAASGTNSGILHTGFDSVPGELETALILRAAQLRDPVLETLGIPILRCGAEMHPSAVPERKAVTALVRNAARNGVRTSLSDDGVLSVPDEAVTDPVRFTLALASAAERHGAELRTRFAVVGIQAAADRLTLTNATGDEVQCSAAVNCAGLGAGRVARLAGDDSFDVFPRKGEFLVFDAGGLPLRHILLPVPTKRTKGVLVFPTIDGKLVAGPTAIDGEDPEDWAVRPGAREEIIDKARAVYPALDSARPVFAYAGLRPAGRGSNYVIGASPACDRLINVAAIRSTGLTASLGIAEYVSELVESTGVDLGPEEELRPGGAPDPGAPWWRRTAAHRDQPGDYEG